MGEGDRTTEIEGQNEGRRMLEEKTYRLTC